MRAANSNATAQVQSLRKPELPQFDKSNIEIWIKRVESAYSRVRVTDPKLKFAHLESKFDVNTDPIINEFLFNTDATEEPWTSFLDYLSKRYGRTTKQEALSVINGTPREGKTPSQLVALMKERAGKVTLDDVLKEQLLKELPADIHRQIVDRVDGLSLRTSGSTRMGNRCSQQPRQPSTASPHKEIPLDSQTRRQQHPQPHLRPTTTPLQTSQLHSKTQRTNRT